ncbi:MAG: hypothetical protein Q8R69_18805, partial [Telluria sp.]|nr:hypothetical protein [Telluria sp.]
SKLYGSTPNITGENSQRGAKNLCLRRSAASFGNMAINIKLVTHDYLLTIHHLFESFFSPVPVAAQQASAWRLRRTA